jgi:hypothetical protein
MHNSIPKWTKRLLVIAGVYVLCWVVWHEAEGSTKHDFHGLCNTGVGRPYEEFIHRLHEAVDAGDWNTVSNMVKEADANSRDIYDVWLFEERDAYINSLK